MWDARITVEPGGLDDRVGVPDPAALRRAGIREAGGGLALFGMANVPFIYISVNYWRTIHPATSGRADAAGRHGRAALVLRCLLSCCSSCCC